VALMGQSLPLWEAPEKGGESGEGGRGLGGARRCMSASARLDREGPLTGPPTGIAHSRVSRLLENRGIMRNRVVRPG